MSYFNPLNVRVRWCIGLPLVLFLCAADFVLELVDQVVGR